jgi:hypothetical protein
MGKSPRKNDRGGLGLVVQAYNPSYLGGRDQEDGILKPAQAKKLARPPSQQISQAWWHAPSYGGGIHIGEAVQVWSWIKSVRPYPKRNN